MVCLVPELDGLLMLVLVGEMWFLMMVVPRTGLAGNARAAPVRMARGRWSFIFRLCGYEKLVGGGAGIVLEDG